MFPFGWQVRFITHPSGLLKGFVLNEIGLLVNEYFQKSVYLTPQQPVSGTRQQIVMAPKRVEISPPVQTPPSAAVEEAKQTAEAPDTNTETADAEGNEHFHHDDTQGLIATAWIMT